ncbi:MAG: thioredoxin domain-containing protein [Ignavibacteriaceae bacterium]
MKKPNRLIKEKSPYLLQHAYNPVDWYPWGEEAFDKARNEDKPVFLSIGYSTCHWCHVMEKESFENDEVAGLMNQYYVSIKVDREERPDIDGIYMLVCQMITGSGGWPLTIIMTPDKKPFYAGTYFPKEDRFGRMGMLSLIPGIYKVWKNKREEILKSVNEISSALNSSLTKQSVKEINENVLDKAFDYFSNQFDIENGGFGTSPKFPTPHNLLFLLRYWNRKNSKKALQMVEKTLRGMYKGGIYDHIGFGFHRYSTDKIWLVPHFEKMIYDQALLVNVYIETFQAAKKEFYKDSAEEILNYVLREMTSAEGGFYSAEDADSEGEEGKFYLWTNEEIKSILSGEDLILVQNLFNIGEEGNWFDPVHEKNTGTNILHLTKDLNLIADELNIDEKILNEKSDILRDKLFTAREKRIHPFKDTKILADWNGLMISALSKAAQVFEENEYYLAAEKAVHFIIKNLLNADGRLLHRFKDGESSILANADDYVFFVQGLLDLYEAGFNSSYLKTAIDLNSDFIKYFWDEKDGGFYFTPSDGEKLLIRQKEIYDGAVPSGNSVAILNLLRIGRITGNSDYEKKASLITKTFSVMIENSPQAFTQALSALDFALGPSKEIIVSGEKNSQDTKEMLRAINEKYIPNKIIIFNSRQKDQMEIISPLLREYSPQDNQTAVYICEDYKCNMPVSNAAQLLEIL